MLDGNGDDLLISGVPVEVSSGKWIGATNLSEFTVAAGLPTGLTRYDDGVDVGTIEIKNDVTEGNYFAVTGSAAAGRYGVGVDAFDGLTGNNYEVLARVHMTVFTSGNRYWPGPAGNLEGLTDAAYRACFMRLKWSGSPPNSINARAIKPTAGGSNTLLESTSSESDHSAGNWVWVRMRRQEMVVPVAGNARFKIKTWRGDETAAGEPASWDAEGDNTAGNTDENDGACGWGGGWFFPDAGEHGVAFFSFTNDPDVTPPPLPAEVAG